MQVNVTKEGVVIPREWLKGVKTVEIRQEGDAIVVVPSEHRSPKSLAEIQSILQQHKPMLQEKYQITDLGIFGSYARGEQTDDSDVDILIDYAKAPSLVSLMELQEVLSEAFNLEVDVVTRNGLKPRIRERVLSEVIYV